MILCSSTGFCNCYGIFQFIVVFIFVYFFRESEESKTELKEEWVLGGQKHDKWIQVQCSIFFAGFEVFEVLPPSGQIKVIIAALNEATSSHM